MAVKTLNQHVLRLLSGLLLLSCAAILVNVVFATIQHAKDQLAADLQVAESIFKQVLMSRDEQLFNSADVLTSDFGFKQAVATGDEGTIESVLINHGNRVSADIMSVMNLQGEIVSSSVPILSQGEQFPYSDLVERVRQERGTTAILLVGDKLYQAILLTVNAPAPIAIALVGFELDNELLERLKGITQLDIVLEVISNDTALYTGSTLQGEVLEQALQQLDTDVSWLSVSVLGNVQHISKKFKLSEQQSGQIWVTLSYEVERLFGEFNALQLKITAIALLSLLLSVLLGALYSSKLSKPLKNLSKISRTIASGQYDQPISLHSNTREIDDLAQSFQSMQKNIAQREEQITYQASHDLLTELQNRYRMSQLLDQKLASGETFQVVAANILGFRGVNDVFGYHNGDLCLQIIASRFQFLGGEAGRLNGGEFLWLPDRFISEEKLEQLQQQLELPVVVEDVVMNVRISIGMLTCPQDSQDTEGVLKRVSICLDEARHVEHARVIYDPQFEQNYLRRLSVISELKKAIWDDSDELNVVYQPKLSLQTGTITKAEALIRWNSNKLGFVPPDEFIGIAEQAGLIGDVTQWVIHRVIKDVHVMHSNGMPINVAINLSAKDIMNDQLLPIVIEQMESLKLPTDALSFEITESDLVSDAQRAVEELQKFRDAGFELAIDDFGTGYSSLAYLKSLPVTDLKIDKSFVLNLDTQAGDQQIVQTILELAHNFELGVIAEGVENQASLMMLKQWGCELIQGYHVCRPIPRDDLLSWYKERLNRNWFDE